MSTLNVDVKLGVNKFRVDEENPHIVLVDSPDPKEFDKLILACPANLYKRDADGTVRFDYAGCLECGKTILQKWEFPQGTLGIEFRFG